MIITDFLRRRYFAPHILAIIEEHAQWTGRQNAPGRFCRMCAGPWPLGAFLGVAWPCKTLKLLAQPFSNREDFDQAWIL